MIWCLALTALVAGLIGTVLGIWVTAVLIEDRMWHKATHSIPFQMRGRTYRLVRE